MDEFETLIDRIKRGDDQAMGELIKHYEPEVLAFSRAHLGPLLRPYLDSVDLVQSVHRSILIGLTNDKFEFSSPEKLIGLAFTMVRRKIARQWQRHRRQFRLEQDGLSSDSLADLLRDLCDVGSDPTESVSLRDQISHILKSCTEADRKLLQLRIEGFTTADAARTLGLDPALSRVRLLRLRERLKNLGVIADLV